MILCPKDCPGRNEHCHSTCKTYLRRKIIHELKNRKTRREKAKAALYIEEHSTVKRQVLRKQREKSRRNG